MKKYPNTFGRATPAGFRAKNRHSRICGMPTLDLIKPRSFAMAFFDPRAQVLPFMTAKLADLWTEVWQHASPRGAH